MAPWVIVALLAGLVAFVAVGLWAAIMNAWDNMRPGVAMFVFGFVLLFGSYLVGAAP